MPKHIQVRTLTDEEAVSIKRLSQSRTEPARRVERAEIIWRSSQGERVAAIAKSLDIHVQTVRLWIARFTKGGVAGLEDQQRTGRKPTYSAEQAGAVLTAALTAPQTLGLPFASWTLDRLQAYLNEEKGIPIKRGRIDQMLLAERLRWRQQETWFGERVDPQFAEKRGASPRSTKRHPKEPSSSV
jgi:transposase